MIGRFASRLLSFTVETFHHLAQCELVQVDDPLFQSRQAINVSSAAQIALSEIVVVVNPKNTIGGFPLATGAIGIRRRNKNIFFTDYLHTLNSIMDGDQYAICCISEFPSPTLLEEIAASLARRGDAWPFRGAFFGIIHYNLS